MFSHVVSFDYIMAELNRYYMPHKICRWLLIPSAYFSVAREPRGQGGQLPTQL